MRHFLWIILFWQLTLPLVSVPMIAQCAQDSGRTERGSYYADVIQTRMYYTVYVPPCYDDTEDDYPVIYLMHGSNEDDHQWLRLGLAEILDEGIAGGEIPPVIVVMPFGEWIANENRFERASWGQVFLDQLMPLVESQYRIRQNRAFRAIGGISRGGFWAFHIGLRNPALFSAVGGHSAFFDRYHAAPEYNPLDLASDAVGIESMRIYLDRGADDYAAPGLDIMGERLRERGLEHTYTIFPEGQHNNAYWSHHVAEYIQFYTSSWPTSEPVSRVEPEPTPTLTPTPAATDDAAYLLLPVVAFPSLQSSITHERLENIRSGEFDNKLILSDEVVSTLAGFGVSQVRDTRTVPAADIYNALWRDRTLFTLLPFEELHARYRVLYVDDVNPLDMSLDAYPFVFASSQPNYDPSKLTRFLLSGVTALTRGTMTALDEHGVAWAAEAISDYVQRPDYFHMSNEVSIYPTCPATNEPVYGGNSSFCSKGEHFDLLNRLKVDVVELSGNHNNDFGYEAYRDTLQWYAGHGIATVGGGETVDAARQPFLTQHHGNSIALLACNWIGPYYALVNEDENALGGIRPGAAYCDLDWLAEVLPRLSAENDLVIVTIQYSEFDQYTPTDKQRSDFQYVADLGADVVIGTQAHFPQTFEFYPKSDGTEAFIHYGLGNLFFDQQFFAGVRFFMDQLFVYDGQLVTVDLFTGIIEHQARPRSMTPDERTNFLYLMFIEYGGF